MQDKDRIISIHYNSIYTRLLELDLPNVMPLEIKELCHNLVLFQRDESYQLNIPKEGICLVINFEKNYSTSTSRNIFDQSWISEKASNGNLLLENVFEIDKMGNSHLDKAEAGEKLISPVEISNFSIETSSCIIVQIIGNSQTIYFKGRPITDIPDVFSLNMYRSYNYKIPVSEYIKILKKYENYFEKRGRKSIFWKSKAKYLLIDSPEVHFIDDMYNWLCRNVSNAQIDEECLNASSNDRLDVRLTELTSGHLFIFEVKWIGKSKGSNYDGKTAFKRAISGVIQLENYLNEESNCVMAGLVLYDARKDKQELEWNKHSPWQEKIHFPPFVIALNPESSSTLASEKSRKRYKH